MKRLDKIFYLFHRLGLLGTVRHYIHKDDEEYEIMYNRYYKTLPEEKYLDELIEWYDYALNRKRDCILNPKSFNDKIQWLKLNDNSEIKTKCSDKYAVRNYISESIGEKFLIPLLGVWESFEEIDFSILPKKFVLKSNTGSGRIIIFDDNVDLEQLKDTVNKWQRLPFGYNGMEIQYLPIERKIIAEEFIEEMDGNLHDYKFHCFNGVPALVEFMGDRDLKRHTSSETWCDIDFNPLKIKEKESGNFTNYVANCIKPENYDKMVEIAKTLSAPFKYVRVDLYNVNGQIYFGELTFTPDNGLDIWEDAETDNNIGSLLSLNDNKKADADLIHNAVTELFSSSNATDVPHL